MIRQVWRRPRMAVVRLTALFCLSLVLGAASFSFAQSPEEAKEEDAAVKKQMNKLRFNVTIKLLGKGAFADPNQDKQDLTQYYTLFIKRFQLPFNRGELPSLRKELRRDLRKCGDAPVQDVHKELVTLLFDQFKAIALDAKQDRVVRFNALLALGDLNEKDPDSLGRGQTIPYQPAVDELLGVWKDDKAEDALRVAALIGLRRHAELGIADKQEQSDLRKLMLAALADKATGENRTKQAQDWIRRRAADVLAGLKSPGEQGKAEVVQALLAVLAEKDAALSLQCGVAHNLGLLDYASARINYSAVAHALGGLAVEVTETPPTTRRLVKHYLDCVRTGLNGLDPEAAGGLLAAADAKHRPFVADVLKRVDDLEFAVDAEKDDEKLPEVVANEGARLKQWLEKHAPKDQNLTGG